VAAIVLLERAAAVEREELLNEIDGWLILLLLY
jgi:hypothetical protein